MTRAEALQNALDWAEGRKSHLNGILAMEPQDPLGGPLGDARQRSIAWCAQADAAEVQKWAALAAMLPETPPLTDDDVYLAVMRALGDFEFPDPSRY